MVESYIDENGRRVYIHTTETVDETAALKRHMDKYYPIDHLEIRINCCWLGIALQDLDREQAGWLLRQIHNYAVTGWFPIIDETRPDADVLRRAWWDVLEGLELHKTEKGALDDA